MKRDEPAARAARSGRLRRNALALQHPDERLVAAIERQKAALLEDAPKRDASWSAGACTALLIGEHALARQHIQRLLEEEEGTPLLRAGLVSQLYAWTGDASAVGPMLAPALAAWNGADDSADRRIIARDLIALAEASASAEALPQLRAGARGADPDQSAGGVLLRELARLESAGADRSDRMQVADALTTGRSAQGVAGWTRLALRDDYCALPLFAAGLIGLDPDADRGRLRARLHVPGSWKAWGARAIRMGTAAVDLHVRRDVTTVEITADQTDGPLPLTLILEVTVHAPVRAARVDATPATLSLRPLADRVIAPVQLVLDAPRTFTLELERVAPYASNSGGANRRG